MSKIVEESLERIVSNLTGLPADTKLMVKQLRIIVKGLEKLRPKDMKKVSEEVTTEGTKLSNTKKASREKIDKLFEEHKEEVEETSKSIGILGVVTKDAGRQFGVFGKSITRIDGSFKSFFDSMSELPLIGGVFAGFAVLASILDSTIDAYRTVTQAGVQFQNGILGLVQSSGELGLSLDDTAKMYKTYNNTIQRIGAPAFTGFIKEVRANSSDLYALGFTYKDIVESSASFLETQRNLTGLRTLNQQEQSKLFDQTIKEFYKAAQITGVGVEEMLKSLKSLSEDPRTRLILKSLPEAGQRLLGTLQNIDPKLTETVLEAIQLGAVERVSNYEDLVTSGTVDLIQGIVGMAQNGSGDMADLRDFLKAHEPALAQRVSELGESGNDGGLNFAASMLKIINDLVDDPQQKVDGGETDKLSELLLKLGPLINESIARIREILLNFTVDILGPEGAFGEIIAKGLIDFIKVVTNPDNIAALITFIDALVRFTRVISGFSSDILNFVGANSPLTNVILTGMIGLIGAKTAMWLAKAAATNLFGSVFGALGKAVGVGVRKSPLGQFIKGAGAAALLAGGAYMIYDRMYDDPDSETPPEPGADETPPTDENQELDQPADAPAPTDTEFDARMRAERSSLEMNYESMVIPPEIQAIVDKMNEQNNLAISEIIEKRDQTGVMPTPPAEGISIEDSSDRKTSPAGPTSTVGAPLPGAITKSIHDMSEAALSEIRRSRERPATVEPDSGATGLGKTLGTPPPPPPPPSGLDGDASLRYEKRILELAEEGANLSKVLAGVAMANASATTDTYRTLTSNVV